jgi:magnesium transporter
MLLAACHSQSNGWTKVDDLSQLSDLREEAGNLLWAEADVADLSDDAVAMIAEEFSLPELAVEDAINPRQRPKVEPYGRVLFIVLHQLDEVDGQLEATQIAAFVGPQFVLTVHAGAGRTLKEAKTRWEENPPEASHESLLLHTLLDVAVDDYQSIADRLESEMEDLEEIVLEKPDAPVQRQLYSLKQRVARLRRYVLPGARILDWVVDPDTRKPFSTETAELFRDVHDHLLRITDQIRNVDELAQAVLDLTQAAQAQRLNEQNRRLAAWAAIFAVDTLIAGIYGMNFELVPEDQELFGFWFAVVLMTVISVGLYAFFKKREWL